MQEIFIVTEPEFGRVLEAFSSLDVIRASLSITYSNRPEAKPELKLFEHRIWRILVHDKGPAPHCDAVIEQKTLFSEPAHL